MNTVGSDFKMEIYYQYYFDALKTGNTALPHSVLSYNHSCCYVVSVLFVHLTKTSESFRQANYPVVGGVYYISCWQDCSYSICFM